MEPKVIYLGNDYLCIGNVSYRDTNTPNFNFVYRYIPSNLEVLDSPGQSMSLLHVLAQLYQCSVLLIYFVHVFWPLGRAKNVDRTAVCKQQHGKLS